MQIVHVEPDNPPHRRFYQVPEVAAMLATSKAQVYAPVRAGDLPAIKLGGRGQRTREFIAANPLYPGDRRV